jgi:hypothetical protein
MAVVGGRLPAEAIQRVVRDHFGRMRACYEDALATRPDLEGRVRIRFLIDRRGRVAASTDTSLAEEKEESRDEGGSRVESAHGVTPLPDVAVRACVARAFAAMEFPEPSGGVVDVTYPIVFSKVAVDD